MVGLQENEPRPAYELLPGRFDFGLRLAASSARRAKIWGCANAGERGIRARPPRAASIGIICTHTPSEAAKIGAQLAYLT